MHKFLTNRLGIKFPIYLKTVIYQSKPFSDLKLSVVDFKSDPFLSNHSKITPLTQTFASCHCT